MISPVLHAEASWATPRRKPNETEIAIKHKQSTTRQITSISVGLIIAFLLSYGISILTLKTEVLNDYAIIAMSAIIGLFYGITITSILKAM